MRARDAGLLVKIENVDAQRPLSGWIRRLKTAWPSCILLVHSPGR